jgi:hypothetical protein
MKALGLRRRWVIPAMVVVNLTILGAAFDRSWAAPQPPAGQAVPATRTALAGAWALASVNGVPNPVPKARLSFFARKPYEIEFYDGCNRHYAFRFSLSDNGTLELERNRLIRTMAACHGVVVDTHVPKVLRSQPIAEIADGILVIRTLTMRAEFRR